eukprot:4793661-Pleurochrysis_carterae.AAC.1
MPLSQLGALRCSPLTRSPAPCAVPLSQSGALRCPPLAARRLALSRCGRHQYGAPLRPWRYE